MREGAAAAPHLRHWSIILNRMAYGIRAFRPVAFQLVLAQ